MSVGFGEFLAVVLFFVCLWHAWQSEGRAFAQQWFFTAYVFAIVRENLFASFQNIEYVETVIRFGSAPAALTLNFASFSYLAYALAKIIAGERADAEKAFGTLGWNMLCLASVIALPLELFATTLKWWIYPLDTPYLLIGNLPYFVPLAWGVSTAFFYFAIQRVRNIPFRGNGQLFALITASPVLGVIGCVVYIAVEFFVGWFASVGLAAAATATLALLWIGIPLVQLLTPTKRNP